MKKNSRRIIISMLKSSFRSKFRFILLQFIHYTGLICTVDSAISSTRQYRRSFSLSLYLDFFSLFLVPPPLSLSFSLSVSRSCHTYLVSITQTTCFFLVICYLVDSSVVYHLLLLCVFSFNFFFLSCLFIYSMFGIFFFTLVRCLLRSLSHLLLTHIFVPEQKYFLFIFFMFREKTELLGCGSEGRWK